MQSIVIRHPEGKVLGYMSMPSTPEMVDFVPRLMRILPKSSIVHLATEDDAPLKDLQLTTDIIHILKSND